MRIAVFGLGYVGCVTAACLARNGHHIIGVDVNIEKVNIIREGKSPIIEPGLAELIESGVRDGRIEATTDVFFAMNQVQIAIICVGTPSLKNGGLELSYVKNVCHEIGETLRHKQERTTIVIRSTILPGAAQTTLIPTLEGASSKQAGKDFGFCVNPEFLREGSAINDFDTPPYTVIGQLDNISGATIAELYADLAAPLFCVPLGTAEMVKYASNAFHALKVVFANEIGNLCKTYQVDSHQVMDIFIEDARLNLSPYYLKPGFSFGGSCLPKDLRALLYTARHSYLQLPVLEAILPSNELQIHKAIEMLQESGRRKVGLIGLSFKPNTDDLRESPAIDLAERLIGKGYELYIYDREVTLSQLHGSNQAFIEQVIPHIGSLMQPSLAETVNQSEVIVVAKRPSPTEYTQLISLLRPDHTLIDLVRLNEHNHLDFGGTYHGICW